MSKATHDSMDEATGEKDSGYKCYFKAAAPDLKFEKEFKGSLIRSIDEFMSITEKVKDSVVSYDCETKTLDFGEKDPMVGFSFSLSPYDGYYIPLRHLVGSNVSMGVLPHLHDFLMRNKVLVYNGPFDLMMLGAEGIDTEEYKTFEVMALVFNADTNIKSNGLKWASLNYLGRKVPTFEEVVGKKATFNMITPEDGCFYACCDTANTFGLYNKMLAPLQKECVQILKVDNFLAKVMPHYLSNEVAIDRKTMKVMSVEAKAEIQTLEKDIFRAVGYPFVIDSNRQLSIALSSIGIDTGERTKSGDMKLDEEHLVLVRDPENPEKPHPLCQKVIDRNSLCKQLGSYMEKFSEIDKGRINYQIFRVPTGRFASGNKDNPYFLKLNYQNLTKPSPAYYQVTEATPDDSNAVLGYSFRQVPGSMKQQKDFLKEHKADMKFVEAFDTKLNVRRAITVPSREEWYFCGLDYVQQELMIAAMLSKDPVMMKAFREKRDSHEVTAKAMFGEANYNSDKRKKAKIANFGLLYGGCLAADTRILTQDGMIEIGALALEGHCEVWTGYSWEEAFAYPSGQKEVREYTFDDGSTIEMTDEHVVFVLEAGSMVEKKASELGEGEILLSGAAPFRGEDYLDSEEWWAIGLFVSVGQCQTDYREHEPVAIRTIEWFIDDEEPTGTHTRLVAYLNRESVNFKSHRKGSCTRYIVEDKGLIERYFYTIGVTPGKSIPDSVWSTNEQNRRSFVSAFSGRIRNGYLGLRTDPKDRNHEEAIQSWKDLHLLLKSLGVDSKLMIGLSEFDEFYQREFVGLRIQILNQDAFKSNIHFFLSREAVPNYGYVDGDSVKELALDLETRGLEKDTIIAIFGGDPDDETAKWEKMPISVFRKIVIDHGDPDSYQWLHLTPKMLRSTSKEPKMVHVFDIEVRSGNRKCYFANGTLVHNSAFTLQKASGLPLKECEEIYNIFWNTMKGLRAWKRQMVSKAYQNGGNAYTPFGRPRRLAYYLGSELPKLKKFGERSVTSHIIQGAGGDVMRIVLYKIRQQILKPYEGRVKFIGCVHDELDLAIRKDVFDEVIPKVIEIMRIQIPNCELPLRVDIEVGYSYGEMFPFVFNEELKKWVPKFE